MKGKIITIEGLDGAGKSTQISMLEEKLGKSNIQYKFIHFPVLNQGIYGKLIAEFLRGEFGALEEVHPKLVALIYAGDRYEHKAMLNQWLEEGYYIIMDRFVNSNIAFQCAKLADEQDKKALKEWILELEFNHYQLPQPDISLFLDVPIAYIEKSLAKNRVGEDRDYLNGKIDIHEADIEFQKNVLAEYKKSIAEQDNFHEIQCFNEAGERLSIEEVHGKVLEVLGM